ncbi:TetR/AcrR family transcriptional regulator [Actinomycetospora atypica]|uniref:TetR/AcrR family transcriptional regulator n=1 Tax=Actinomycetospora atypica TaxID=1290095 RepID=A0ABV9YSF9_9PSEU
MATRAELLDGAIEVLRRGDALTLDAVARETGLTKPGVVHHFKTKEGLSTAVVDRITQRWENELHVRLGDTTGTARTRLRAYVDFCLTEEFDASDLALLADQRLREDLSRQWVDRIGPWFGADIGGGLAQHPRLQAARLLADGAWFNQALGVVDMTDHQKRAVREVALQLIDDEEEEK